MSTSLGFFSGHLGRDPETRELDGGKTIARMSIGVNVGFGENKKTLWVNAVAFGRTAETIGKFCQKGSYVEVSGEIRPNEWEKDGVKNRSFELAINAFNFGPRAENSGNDPGAYRPSGDTGTRKAAEKQAPAESEDDLPF